MKFREYTTTSGKLVLAGKSAENNEELVKEINSNEDVFHTAKPGSPFVVIKANRTNKQDRVEAAVFCASYSQDYRDNKSDVLVHEFKGSDIYKRKLMKTGTFGVKKFKLIKIKKQDIINFVRQHKQQ